MNLAEAKSKLSIHELWTRLNFPSKPGKSCHSPFHEDRTPSFSVYQDGHRWHDFATGDGGDAIDFLQRATGLSQREACRKFIEMAGGAR